MGKCLRRYRFFGRLMRFSASFEETQHFVARRVRKGASADPIIPSPRG